MQNLRVLIIESVDDDLTRRRAEHLANSSVLKEYIIDHCYAMEITENDRNKPIQIMMSDVTSRSLKKEDLFRRLDVKTQSFQPNFILLHTGFIFHTFQITFIQVLKQLKTKYPQIKFGYEIRPTIDRDLIEEGIFDTGIETKEIENLFFFKVYGR